MCKRVIMAALAATLIGSGLSARAMTTSSSAWLETSNNYRDSLTTPNLPFVVGTRLAPGGPGAGMNSPFAFQTTSPFGVLSASGTNTALFAPQFSGNAADGQLHALRNFDLTDQLDTGAAFGLGYDFDQGRRFTVTDVRGDPAFAGLFAPPSDFNYTGFGQSGIHASASVPLGGGVSLNFGGSESGLDQSLLQPSLAPYPATGTGFGSGRQDANSVLAGVDWKVAPWVSVDLSASHDSSHGGFVDGAAGMMALGKASSDTLGASGHVALGKGWVTSFSYNEGITQLDLKPGVNLVTPEADHSSAYSVAVAKHGLFGDDSLGIALSRPLNLGTSGLGLGTTPVDPFDGFISSNTHPILGGQRSETDLQLGYVTTFMDGALALQANAGYQMNAQGQPGTNGMTVLSRAKINF